MLMNSISIMDGYVFQSANGHKEIGVRAASANSVFSVSEYVSNPKVGNLDNSVMDKKQGETCFHFFSAWFKY